LVSVTTNKGRVTSVGSFLSGVTYNGIGQLTGTTLGNGVTEGYGYDANRMQLTSQTATQSGGPTNGLMNLTYGYQASAGQMGAGTTAGHAGQLMSISGTIGGVTESAAYTFDDLGRLVTSNQTSNTSSAQRRFAYDRWGNRTGMWDATSGGNQIQSITLQQSGGAPTNRITSVTAGSTVNYTYDAAGNLTNDGVHSYGYDSENRIVSVDGGSTASYAYDNQNRRYKKTISATLTHYVWQGSQVLSEHNGSTGAVLIDYVYSGSRLIAKVASGSTQYFLSDRLSVRLSLDSNGNVVGRQGHLPFGEDFGESGLQEKHHFTSYERDGESATDYAINRQYSQTVAKFLRTDPLRRSCRSDTPQNWDRYSYSQNDPIGKIDPLGLETWDECWSRHRELCKAENDSKVDQWVGEVLVPMVTGCILAVVAGGSLLVVAACAAALLVMSYFKLKQLIRDMSSCLAKRVDDCRGLPGEPEHPDPLHEDFGGGNRGWEGNWGIGSSCTSFNWVANAECHGTTHIDPLEWTIEAAQIGD
jgi:RHS repeat-associated protein